MKKAILSLVIAAMALGSAQAEKLVIKGSDTLGAKMVPQLAEAFKARNPGTTFEIAAEGSTTGIAAITDGTADIGMSSRRARGSEVATAATRGVKMVPTIVSFDGMGIIVNQNNPMTGISKSDVAKIFTGDVTDWSQVGGKAGKISVYTRNTASGTYQDFKDLAMNKRDYAKAAQKMAGNEQIAAEVGKNANGIGYVGIAYLKAPGIKVLPVDGVMVNKQTVQSKKYPYARPNFFYTNGAPAGKVKEFIDFLLSPAGHVIVDQVGFVPAK
ncbi:MAG: phosphate ABC transporter substrate-binding protein [Blastochloris sp.]|nr:phosphate ABC transporter substrate-binding protein [Blastochloris sp.]